MCLTLYLAADRPLEPFDNGPIRIEPLKVQRWNRGLFPESCRYQLRAGCACALLSDGETEDEERQRQSLLDEVGAYVARIVRDEPVEALICWGGDEKKSAEVQTISAPEFQDFDFNRAWDVPTRLTIYD